MIKRERKSQKLIKEPQKIHIIINFFKIIKHIFVHSDRYFCFFKNVLLYQIWLHPVWKKDSCSLLNLNINSRATVHMRALPVCSIFTTDANIEKERKFNQKDTVRTRLTAKIQTSGDNYQ